MNPLFSLLLGQQASNTMAGAANPNEPDLSQQGIDVVGWNPVDMPSQTRPPEDYTLDNTKDVMLRDEANRRAQEASNRKGMFGVGGTLRDVLGLVGDSFLLGQGKNPLYMARRDQEKFSDAMAGASRDPMAAYERGLGINPEAAGAFRKDFVTGQNATVRNQIDQAEYARKLQDSAMARAGQIMAAVVNDPSLRGQAEQAIAALSAQTGIPVEQLIAGGDPNIVASRESKVNQTLRLPHQERMVEVAEGNLAARRQQVQIAAKNARTAKERVDIYRKAVEERIRAGQVEEALDILKMMDGGGDGGSSRRGGSSGEEKSGGSWTIRPAGN